MRPHIRLLSTDFDDTLHAEFDTPPVPLELQDLIAQLQAQGMAWVINTGRELSSLMEALVQARLSIWPDYLVTVEREIHFRNASGYTPFDDWNLSCTHAHAQLFAHVQADLPRIIDWIQSRFRATIYEDLYSPFCLIAGSPSDADHIHAYLDQYCTEVPHLTVVRNQIYARLSHADFNKGSALGEIARRLEIERSQIVAAGDHFNDLPMLSGKHAQWLIAPSNAIPPVKELVRGQNGFISEHRCGHGVAHGLRSLLMLGNGIQEQI